MDFNNIEEAIMKNELKLLDKNIRSSRIELEKMISLSFIEYASSGSIYTYNEIISSLPNEIEDLSYKMIQIETKRLAENIVLVLYTVEINNTVTNRSSIWQEENDEWKLLFHQGTKSNIINENTQKYADTSSNG